MTSGRRAGSPTCRLSRCVSVARTRWIGCTACSRRSLGSGLPGLPSSKASAASGNLIPARAGSASTDERAAWAMMWLLDFDNVENPADLRPRIGALDGYVIATRRRLSTSMEKRSPDDSWSARMD
ncbi:hypothetical protein ACWDFR_18225 [Streptomyces sp. 900105755]